MAAAVVVVVAVVGCRFAPPAASGGCETRPREGSSCAPGDGARRREGSSSLRCCDAACQLGDGSCDQVLSCGGLVLWRGVLQELVAAGQSSISSLRVLFFGFLLGPGPGHGREGAKYRRGREFTNRVWSCGRWCTRRIETVAGANVESTNRRGESVGPAVARRAGGSRGRSRGRGAGVGVGATGTHGGSRGRVSAHRRFGGGRCGLGGWASQLEEG